MRRRQHDQQFEHSLDLAAAHGIRSPLLRFPLELADEALTKLETARPAGRVVLVVEE